MQTKIFVSVLTFAILMSLTGHVFLHLADEPFSAETTQQLSAHHEEPVAQTQSHQCSICLDHQALTLDLPFHSAALIFAAPVKAPVNVASNYEANKFFFTSGRAPPRS